MKNKRYRLIVVGSLVTIAVLAATVFGCVRYASEAMTRYSYDVLTASTRRLARDYYDTARTDQTILRTMAELLAMQTPGDAEAALGVMNSFDLERTLIRSLGGTRESVWTLYWMVGIVGAVLLGCMAFIAHCLIADRRSVYRMSQTDQGTGLLNRSAYEKYLRDNAQRTFTLAACVYIDANGLHEINNKYGHEAGDRMLRTVANCLRAQFAYGRIYRIGGDEFVVSPLDAEQRRCEARMRKVAAAIRAEGYAVSYGVACRRDETGLDALVRAADERMLDYKRAYYAEHDRRRPR